MESTVPDRSIVGLLERLEELKRVSDSSSRARMSRLLNQLARRRFTDAATLIRFHEILLFLRAYPQSRALLRETEKLLSSFAARVERLRATGADVSSFEYGEVSGIAGTGFSAQFSYDIVRWLARAHPRRVALVWEGYEETARLMATLPRFLPLFEEDAYADAHVPYLVWLRAARRKNESELAWLVRHFERLPLTEKQKAELFDPLKLWLRWELGDSKATRTRMRRPVRRVFYHAGALLRRSDVHLAREIRTPPMPFERLAPARAEALLAMGRETMAVRYRELHGFTYGDPRTVRRAEAGRGVEIFMWGVAPARRLPTLAYHAAFILKNGVPVGYAEGLSLFERVEIGLNLYSTFRDGESAWVYARLMRLFHQALGARVFSVDPYQLGHGNDEGIASGAYWFYRKLGFRPVQPALDKLTLAEERKIASRPDYRTPARTLHRLSAGHMLYEISGDPRGDDGDTTTAAPRLWDGFRVHNIGLAVVGRMAGRFGGDAGRMRRAETKRVARALDVETEWGTEAERRAFGEFALVLALIPDLPRWSPDEKAKLRRILRAKAGADELQYVRLLNGHARLRREIIRLGTSSS